MRLVAHRAATTGREPHNALDSITGAWRAGADGVEVDVRQTRDGVLVLRHDPLVLRFGVPFPVRRLPRAALPQLSTLDDALAATDDPRLLVLDVKEPRLVPRLIAWAPPDRRVALWCRDQTQVRRAADSGVFAEVALLRNTDGVVSSRSYVADARACGAQAISLHPRAQQSDVVRVAHDAGLFVYAWVRRPSGHALPIDLGVDGLVTDWLAAARSAVRDAG